MSIYRKSPQAHSSDLYATPIKPRAPDNSGTPPGESKDPSPVASPSIPPAILAMRQLDQTTSALLRFTIQWAEALPSRAQPHTLMREFPRIANKVALLWTEPTRTAFDEYMESLLVDRRGTRKGFPPEVASDLITLRAAFDERYKRR